MTIFSVLRPDNLFSVSLFLCDKELPLFIETLRSNSNLKSYWTYSKLQSVLKNHKFYSKDAIYWALKKLDEIVENNKDITKKKKIKLIMTKKNIRFFNYNFESSEEITNIINLGVSIKNFTIKLTQKEQNIANIISKFDIDSKEKTFGQVCFHFNEIIVQTFIEGNDIDINSKCIYDGQTCLHIACINNNIGVIKLLLERYKMPIDLATELYGLTPLMLLSYIGALDSVKYLVEKGASINKQAKNGQTSLDKAIIMNKHEVVRYLQSQQTI